MKLDLSFAELHAPLFLSGKNFGMKLDHGKHPGIGIVYDRGEKELVVTWKEATAIIPLSNVASMTPAVEKKPAPAVVGTTMKAAPVTAKATAQVETPQSHVHAGPGQGSTGQTKGKVVL